MTYWRSLYSSIWIYYISSSKPLGRRNIAFQICSLIKPSDSKLFAYTQQTHTGSEIIFNLVDYPRHRKPQTDHQLDIKFLTLTLSPLPSAHVTVMECSTGTTNHAVLYGLKLLPWKNIVQIATLFWWRFWNTGSLLNLELNLKALVSLCRTSLKQFKWKLLAKSQLFREAWKYTDRNALCDGDG